MTGRMLSPDSPECNDNDRFGPLFAPCVMCGSREERCSCPDGRCAEWGCTQPVWAPHTHCAEHDGGPWEDSSDCTRCGGSGGGPDAALKCGKCNGSGVDPSYQAPDPRDSEAYGEYLADEYGDPGSIPW